MSTRKIDGWWYADFYACGKRYRMRSPQNTAPATRAYEQYLRGEIAKMGSLDHLDPKIQAKQKVEPTFGDFAERWMREYVAVNNRHSTMYEKRRALNVHLLPAFCRHKLSAITTREIERYKTAKSELLLTPKSINNQLTILRKCLVTAKQWEELNEVPHIQFLKALEPPFRFLTREQAAALIAAAPAGLWRAMITVALRTGMRFSELIALQWNDIDWTRGAHGMVTVRRARVRGVLGPPKSNRVRYLALTSDAASELRRIAPVGNRGEIPVLTFEGRWVRYDTAWKHLRQICDAAGIDRVSWHDLRHSFASHLVSANAPIKAVQELLGHATIDMTLRYTHLEPNFQASMMSLLDPGESNRWAANGQEPATTLNDQAQALASGAANLRRK